MNRWKLKLSLYLYSTKDGALFCVFTFCMWLLLLCWRLDCDEEWKFICWEGFAWMFCFVVIDERIFVDKVANGEEVKQMNSWVGFVFRGRNFFFFLFLKNKLYGLEIGSFLRKCLMLFLWEEYKERVSLALVWSLISIAQVARALHNEISS